MALFQSKTLPKDVSIFIPAIITSIEDLVNNRNKLVH